MTIAAAAELVLRSVWEAKGGEVLITKMSTLRIADLAAAMWQKSRQDQRIEILEIGAKPGEKLYEELMTEEEVRRAYDCGTFFAVVPAFLGKDSEIHAQYQNFKNASRPYKSCDEECMSIDEIGAYLVTSGLA